MLVLIKLFGKLLDNLFAVLIWLALDWMGMLLKSFNEVKKKRQILNKKVASLAEAN